MTKAAIYCRRSKATDAKGVERQRADALAIARDKGWEISEGSIYIDNNISASEFSRKARTEYLRMLADIEAGKYQAIILWMEDRGHRQVIEAAEFVHLCRDHGVSRIVVTSDDRDYDLTDPLAVAEFYGKAAEAQKESAKTAKRLRRQRLDAAQRGERHTGSPRHFGFQARVRQRDAEGNVISRDAVPMRRVLGEQELIREAVARILAGDSVRGIVTDWNRRGIRTSQDKEWSRFGFRRMITSPAIAGYREHRPTINGRRERHGTLYEAQWAPIVPRADWEAIRAILTDPTRTTTRGRGPAYLLTGMVYCGACGQRMRARNHWRHAKDKRPLYMCEKFGPDAPPRLARLVSMVDREVENRLFYRVESRQFAEASSRAADDPTQEIANELARLQGLLDRLEDKVADELIKPSTAQRKRAQYEREMDALRSKQAALTGERVRARIPDNLREVWPDLSLDRRRAILAAAIELVVILPVTTPGRTVFQPKAIVVLWRDRKNDPPALTALPWWHGRATGRHASE